MGPGKTLPTAYRSMYPLCLSIRARLWASFSGGFNVADSEQCNNQTLHISMARICLDRRENTRHQQKLAQLREGSQFCPDVTSFRMSKMAGRRRLSPRRTILAKYLAPCIHLKCIAFSLAYLRPFAIRPGLPINLQGISMTINAILPPYCGPASCLVRVERSLGIWDGT